MSVETKQKISEKRRLRLGERSSNWKGGRFLSDGYWYVHSPAHPLRTKDGYVKEHRLVIEQHLGRYLAKTEIVHHLNGVKTDNRLENLCVCQSVGKHSAEYHMKRGPGGRFQA